MASNRLLSQAFKEQSRSNDLCPGSLVMVHHHNKCGFDNRRVLYAVNGYVKPFHRIHTK